MSAAHPAADRVSETETARLLRHSGGRALALEFGPAGVRLQRDPADGRLLSAWAAPLLASWRGDTVNEGGGI